MTVAYEEVSSEYCGTHEYYVPNEDISLWREMIKGIRIDRAAGICSSGEIGLFCLLPSVRKDLVLIDHSYAALRIAMTKYLYMKENGPKKIKEIISQKDGHREFRTMTEQMKDNLPDGFNTDRHLRYDSYATDCMPVYWNSISDHLIRKSFRKLSNVKFIHGDLTDLTKYGQFSAFYMSNAQEHIGRGHMEPMLENIEKIVKPGGLILCTSQRASKKQQMDARWEIVDERQAELMRDNWNLINWRHIIYRTPS